MGDDHFTQSLDGLSHTLGERAALDAVPVAEAMARRISVQAGFAARERRLRFILGGVAAGLGSAVATVLILFFAWPPDGQLSPSPTRVVAVASPPVAASVVPNPVIPDLIVPDPVIPAAVVAAEFAAPPAAAGRVPPSTSPAPVLGHKEVREAQTRLRVLGFNPGPIDGGAGRLTATAVTAYQEKRGLPQTGELGGRCPTSSVRSPSRRPSPRSRRRHRSLNTRRATMPETRLLDVRRRPSARRNRAPAGRSTYCVPPTPI